MRTSTSICEETGLMIYIGEILYATSSSQSGREDGLAWTREAVDISEETLHKSSVLNMDRSTEKICKQCLSTGLENWRVMVGKLVEREREAKEARKGKSSWLGFGSGGSSAGDGEGKGRWESEEMVVMERVARANASLFGEVNGGESGYLKV